jgi:hypothetical protein
MRAAARAGLNLDPPEQHIKPHPVDPGLCDDQKIATLGGTAAKLLGIN